MINPDTPETDVLLHDDYTGYLFNECMKQLMNRETPDDQLVEAANYELAETGVKICLT